MPEIVMTFLPVVPEEKLEAPKPAINYLTGLPEEMLNKIYGYLSINDLSRVAQTSNAFKGISLRKEILKAKNDRLNEIAKDGKLSKEETYSLVNQLLFGDVEAKILISAIENLLPEAIEIILSNECFGKKFEINELIDLLDQAPKIKLAREEYIKLCREGKLDFRTQIYTRLDLIKFEAIVNETLFSFPHNISLPAYKNPKHQNATDLYKRILIIFRKYQQKIARQEAAEKKAIETIKEADKHQARIKKNFFSFLYKTKVPTSEEICANNLQDFANQINRKPQEMGIFFNIFKPSKDTKQLIATTSDSQTLIWQLFNVYRFDALPYVQYANAEKSSLFISEDNCKLFLAALMSINTTDQSSEDESLPTNDDIDGLTTILINKFNYSLKMEDRDSDYTIILNEENEDRDSDYTIILNERMKIKIFFTRY